jgi:glycosyl transferase family 25
MPAIDWPIYVINLDDAVERRAAAAAQFNRTGISFERFPAVDGATLTQQEVDAVIAPGQITRFKRALSRSEIGCFLSHLKLWRLIAAGDKPAAFVFEDDVEIDEDGPMILEVVAERPADWDLLRLYSDREVRLVADRTLGAGYSYGVPRRLPLTSVAYAITRTAAARVAELALPFSRPIDVEFRYWWRHGVAIKQVVPSPFRPNDGHLSTSAIVAGRHEHHSRAVWLRFLRNTRYQLRALINGARYRRHIRRGAAWAQAPRRPARTRPTQS